MAARERQGPRECEWLLKRISLAFVRVMATQYFLRVFPDQIEFTFFPVCFYVLFAVVRLLSVVIIEIVI